MSDGRGRGQADGRMSGRRRKRRQSERQTGGGGVGCGGVSEKKDTAVSQHTQWKAGGSVPCPQRDTRTVAVVVVYLERGGDV